MNVKMGLCFIKSSNYTLIDENGVTKTITLQSINKANTRLFIH